MFIRETIKTQKGKRYIQHQLIESIRTPRGPRQKLILNIGSLKLPKDKWKLLANTIESELSGYKDLFESDPDIKKLAEHYAGVIIQKRLNEKAKEIEETEQERKIGKETVAPQYKNVDINSLSTSGNRTIGAEYAVLSMMREYKLDNILKKLGFTDKQVNDAVMLIASRLVHPSSENKTVRWINEDSAICELLKLDAKVYDNALHRTAALLMKHHKDIEKSLSEKSKELFDLPETIILGSSDIYVEKP